MHIIYSTFFYDFWLLEVVDCQCLACRQYDAFDLFRTPNLRKKTIVVIFDTFCVYSVYNGLNFFVPHLGSEEHISFLLASLVELPSYLVLYLTLNRFGRRPVLLLSMVLGGAFCILCSVVPENNDHLVKATFLISKFCITCSYFVTDLFATELFPTVVRGAGASLSQTISAVGLCFSPLIAYFAHKLFYLPLLIFGLLSIVGGVVSMILPETVNQPLPETLEEGEELGRPIGGLLGEGRRHSHLRALLYTQEEVMEMQRRPEIC